MADWSKGGVLGSLRKTAAQEFEEHRKTNPALLSARPPLGMRLLRAFFKERGLLGFLLSYAAFVILLLILEFALTKACPNLVLSSPNIGSLLKEVTSYLLGAQVTMIGLLFPIAVALVTFIVQREDASSTVADVQVYYGETLAYRIGASGIALSIVLAVQLVWPAHFVAHRFGFNAPTELSKVLLTATHLFWLSINFAALWHFLFTSLSFARPAQRALFRRRFAAAVSIPEDVRDRLARALYANAGRSFSPPSSSGGDNDDVSSILFGSHLRDWGDTEVANPHASTKVLHDVWMRPLGWGIRRWLRRSAKLTSPDGYGSSPTLMFAPELGRPLPEDGTICRRRNGVPLNGLERFVVRQCFRLRKPKQ